MKRTSGSIVKSYEELTESEKNGILSHKMITRFNRMVSKFKKEHGWCFRCRDGRVTGFWFNKKINDKSI